MELEDYGSDLLTDFESDMFCSTSKITNKSVSVAKRTRNFKTSRGEIARVPQLINGRCVQQGRNRNKGKQDYVTCGQDQFMIGILRQTYDHTPLQSIPAFFQPLPPTDFRNHTRIENNLSGSDFEQLNDAAPQMKKKHEHAHGFSLYRYKRWK